MQENGYPEVGDHVIFTDEKSQDHAALVTASWGSPENGPRCAINLLYVSDDPSRTDQYGRQIVRPSSVCNGSMMGVAHGYYWRWPSEEKKPYQSPGSV